MAEKQTLARMIPNVHIDPRAPGLPRERVGVGDRVAAGVLLGGR